MSIQRASEGDRAAIQRLAEECNADEGIELAFDPDGPALVYRNEGDIVGFAALEGGKVVETTGMVHTLNRRRGIGRALLEAARDELRQQGTETWYLVIDEGSPSGRGFVASVGGSYHISEYRMELDRSSFPGAGEWRDPLELAPSGIEELDLFAQVMSAAFEDPLEVARSFLDRDMRQPNRRFWIARAGNEPIGTVRVIGSITDVYVTALGVLPAYRGRGFGRQILSRTTSMLIDEGWKTILIEVETDNRNALSLYRSVGYRETRTYGFYELPL